MNNIDAKSSIDQSTLNESTAVMEKHSLNAIKKEAKKVIEQEKKLPGDLAMWFFILAELSVFAIFFIGFAVAEHSHTDLFAQSKALVHPIAGLINTLALITSSFAVALSLQAMHNDNTGLATKRLVYALLFACIYIVVKVWEYQTLFSQGIDIETNTFFTLYFLITFFHLMHVLLGMVILIYIAVNTNKGRYSQTYKPMGGVENKNSMSGFESGTCYWHMVDLLWIILFPLIYVI
jgi:nitric oxide reductase NorE protein